MLTSKIRISIITAVAALSVLSLGPMTSVASARPVVKVGKIQIDCSGRTIPGTYGMLGGWFEEGEKVTVGSTDENGNDTYTTYTCVEGDWVVIVQEGRTPSSPKTTQEGPSVKENS